MKLKKNIYRFAVLCLLFLTLYGIGRLYFQLTAGFTIANISSDFAYNPEWEVRPLSSSEQDQISRAFDQPYHYLGKGCQSYVFLSEDGNYVIKFFKYQRYRLQPWLTYAPPLPALVKYRQEKIEKKWHKLDGFVKSWKVAFEQLKDETGLLFVHLNKTRHLNKQLTLYDKIGRTHLVDLDQMEFCVQGRAHLLCETLLALKSKGDIGQAQQLIASLLNLILSEYHRGLADNDHALMQNTGVFHGHPIHIDVGQFVQNEAIKDPQVYHQELYTKTYKFKLWLQEFYPELAEFLDIQLSQIIGSDYSGMTPKFQIKSR